MRVIALMMILIMMTSTLAGCFGEDVEPYKDKIEQLETDNAILESENNNLLEQVNTLETDNAILESENNNLLEQVNTLESEKNSLENQIENLELEKQLLESEKNFSEIQIKNLEIEKQLLESEKNSSEIQIENLELDKQLLALQIVNLTTQITNLNDQILALEDDIEDLTIELENSMAVAIPASTLDVIIERGSLKCGVKNSQRGMGFMDSNGVRSGLDISYCRAIAAAIGLDPDTDIEYVDVTPSNRFSTLESGTIDVLIRTTTRTTSRDAGLNVDFAATNFYDGTALMVSEDYNYGSINTLSGITICAYVGSTTEGNLNDYFSSQGMSYSIVGTSDPIDATNKFNQGQCDALAGDRSGLAAKWLDETDSSTEVWSSWITPEVISKEPLSAAVRDYDSEWKDIVEWVWHGMVTAEELGIDSSNYQNADTTNNYIQRLLEQNLGLGTENNPLSDTWMQDVLEHVGNYGEAYSDAFCGGNIQALTGTPQWGDCAIYRQGSLNDLVSGGGVMYAPTIR